MADNSFLLTNGIVIPLSALVIQRYTTRQVFLVGISIFFLGTLLGGLSPHFATLLVARIIQALGAGIMMPLMMTTILMFSNRMNAVNIWGYLVW